MYGKIVAFPDMCGAEREGEGGREGGREAGGRERGGREGGRERGPNTTAYGGVTAYADASERYTVNSMP